MSRFELHAYNIYIMSFICLVFVSYDQDALPNLTQNLGCDSTYALRRRKMHVFSWMCMWYGCTWLQTNRRNGQNDLYLWQFIYNALEIKNIPSELEARSPARFLGL